MGKAGGMTPREIRAAMVLRGVKIIDIAAEAGVTPAYVHHTINGTGRNKGYRVRPYIARAIGKKEEEIWPGGKKSKKQKVTASFPRWD